MTLTMCDSAGGDFPAAFDCYAGYVDRVAGGHEASYGAAQAAAKANGARALSITTDSDFAADVFDMESGAESYTAAPAFFAKKTTPLPVMYCAGSAVDTVVRILTAAGIARKAYRILSAHYGDGEHICGPHTCGVCSTTCDGTQWEGTAAGADTYDVSVLVASFFETSQPEETPMAAVGIATGHRTGTTGAEALFVISAAGKLHIPTPADVTTWQALGLTELDVPIAFVDGLAEIG